jgi:hypothetical protein
MAELGYTVDENDLQQTFDPVPAGEYLAVIEDSDYVETKSGTGRMLKLKLQIIDGPMKGRKLFDQLNLENVNKQAEQIARQTLNSIGVAVNVLQIKDSAQLHNIPMRVDVRIKESEEYGKQNSIKKYLPASGAAPRPALNAGSSAPAGEKPLVSGADKPWLKK